MDVRNAVDSSVANQDRCTKSARGAFLLSFVSVCPNQELHVGVQNITIRPVVMCTLPNHLRAMLLSNVVIHRRLVSDTAMLEFL